ncbi:CynX/NimT family MFS transporter [Hydrogenophaga defluvii]|uniref:CynX/NimT family MFS transporter n=1 Tax=Hydrogenophaga defluvii TaxID=249410 RepID=A0ABW2S8Z4_9BURK
MSDEALRGRRMDPALLVVLAGVCAALHVGKLPPAIPVLREALGISLVAAGFLLSAVQIAGMTTGLLVGRLADGLGLRRSMLLGLAVLALASAAGAMASGVAALLVLRAVEGLGFLLVVLPAPSMVRRLVAPERMSRVLGWWGGYMPLGTALALLVGPVFTESLGWPAWWALLGLLSAAMALWLWRVVPPDPAPMADGRAAEQSGRAWLHPMQLTLRAPGPWLVALCFGLYAAQWLSVVGFLPSIYREAAVPGAWVGLLTAGVAAINIVGNVAAGRLLHRGWAPAHLLWLGCASMAVGAAMAFASSVHGTGLPPLGRYGGVLLFSCGGGLIPGTLFSLAVRVAPNDHTVATTVGWMQQWSALGQFAGPPVVAWVAVRAGSWRWTWLVTVACAAGCALLALRLHRHVRPRAAV